LPYPSKCSLQSRAGRAWEAAPLAAAASLTVAALAFTGVPLAQANPSLPAASGKADLKRQVENLDRAPVAVVTDQGVSLGWRMLGLDQDSVGFHVIRDGVQLTEEPIRNTTTYVDPAGTAASKYLIKTVGNGNGQDKLSAEFTPLAQNYRPSSWTSRPTA
jgi:rhamnogalacturonan endolyase